jgi:hypothetical protein
MNNNTNVYSLLLLMVAIATVSVIGGGSGGGLVATLPGFDNAYGLAAAAGTTTTAATTTTNQTQATEEENLFISQNIPLTGKLENGDYLHLIDLAPFNTTAEGHIAIKVPCDDYGKPLVTIISGVAPNFRTLEVGNSINNGTFDGKNIKLSIAGSSCFYHGKIPNGITDIALVNTSNQTLNFEAGGYSAVITAHATINKSSGGALH